MTDLTTEQLIYLLYADAYSEAGTVTKGTVKSYLVDAWKAKADKTYAALQQQELIKPISKGRFLVTEQGKTALVINLCTTDYKFDSVKGPKVLNILLKYIGEATKAYSQYLSPEKMTFDEFINKFKTLYFEERKKQSLQGVVAIHKGELSKYFMEKNSISQHEFDKNFERLRAKGEISVIEGREDKLIEWVE